MRKYKSASDVLTIYLALIVVSCGHSKTNIPPYTPNPAPNPPGYTIPGGNNSGANNSSSTCGPYNANAGGSSGATPPYPANIIDLLGQTSGQPINLCTTTGSSPAIPAGVTYVQISSADTLFIWSDTAINDAQVSTYPTTDTAGNDDRFEFLGSALTVTGSGGGQDTSYVPRNINKGYQLSSSDLSNFVYSFSKPIYLSGTENGNSLGNFLGKSGYLAFRIYSHSAYQYGWVSLQLSPTYHLSVFEVVINSYTNTPLTIGQYQ